MNGAVPRVAWYRFQATFGRRWTGYLTLVLLVGVIGGLALGSIAGARRTQSSFPAFFASVNPPDLVGITSVLNPALGSTAGYDGHLLGTLSRLPHVRGVESASGIDVLPLGPNGAPSNVVGFPPAAGNGLGSDNGLFFDQAANIAVEGRTADPSRADEVEMTTEVADAAHVHVGQRIKLGIYTNAQTELPAFGTAGVTPYRQTTVTVVGLVDQASQIVEDQVDDSQSLAFFTPAFTRPLLSCCSNYTETGIQVDRSADVSTVDSEVQKVLPKQFPAPIVASTIVDKAERAIKPESIALGTFGLIAALAALFIAAQVIGRQVRLGVDDLAILRALGADPAMTSSDGLIGLVSAVVVGSLLAVAVAVALSPLTPLGPVRPVDPHPGVSFDWTVLGLGLVVLIGGLSSLAVFLSIRQAPHLAAERRLRIGEHPSGMARAAASSGLPAPAVTGIRFALEPGVGRNAVPVRSAILGAALAIVVVVSTITFGASLSSLVSHPALYGWNWNYVLSAGGGSGDIPATPARNLLDRDRYVRAWSSVYFDDLTIDHQTVPVVGENPGTAVQPPVLSGHQLEAGDQIVLGATTLAQLHKHVGDTVHVSSGVGTSTPLQIVGTATMPTIGGPGPHLEMGTGAVLAYQLIPAPARNPFNDPTTGPESIFVDLRPGADPKAALQSLNRMSVPLSNNFNFGVFVGSVLKPAEIVNYRSVNNTPAILGGTLGLGAVVALALTLMASVRRRRRDLALLRTLGFTGGQLASVVAWQSTVAVGIGTVVGVPLGIVLGRVLWDLFANDIHAVPAPSVPTLSVVLVAVGALVLANVVAAIPGRMAARTPTAQLMRAE